jgi:hypothetical protein
MKGRIDYLEEKIRDSERYPDPPWKNPDLASICHSWNIS